MKSIKVGLLGAGTVGAGTFEVLKRNQEEITRRAGRAIEIVMVADLDLERATALTNGQCQVVGDAGLVVSNPEIDIVIELIGGYGVARTLVLQAIANGKHVVTANKALLAMHGNEIFAAAQEKGVMVAFEAAVAGGIPIIKALREGLTANRIEWIAGIINGTTNFILSEMRDKGLDFDVVLKEAQAPRLRRSRSDLRHRRASTPRTSSTIMASIAFGVPMQFEQARYVEGITKLQAGRHPLRRGARLPHQAARHHAPHRASGIELRVHPTLMPAKRLIANVEGAMNAVLVQGDAVGATLYYGKGAGAEPTASAVIADLVDVTRLHTADPEHRVPHLAFQPRRAVRHRRSCRWAKSPPATTCACACRTEPGVLADITRILADRDDLDRRHAAEGAAGRRGPDRHHHAHPPDQRKERRSAAIAKIEALPTVLRQGHAHPDGRTGLIFHTRGAHCAQFKPRGQGDFPTARAPSPIWTLTCRRRWNRVRIPGRQSMSRRKDPCWTSQSGSGLPRIG